MSPTLALELQTLETLITLAQVLWVMAFGACVGSLTNVLVYRIPRGLDFVTPTSRCPSCETKLTWRENIPIFGWLFLGGKCRFCRSPISAEYPIVEAVVACLWGLVFLALYAREGTFWAVPFEAIQPEWAAGGFRETWPTFIIIVTLFSCLVAMTLIDAKTFQIPMLLTTVPVVVALIGHPLHALYIQQTREGLLDTAQGEVWTMATPGPRGWWWIGGAIGGAVGIILSNVLLALGLFKRSFADYPEWEKQALAAQTRPADSGPEGPAAVQGAAPGEATPSDPISPSSQADLWIQYPHARREMLRELIFLGPAIGLGLLGAGLAAKLVPTAPDHFTGLPAFTQDAPLWLTVLAGVLIGYLIGGGVVWAVRILGSLAFGKEALGLGDVHLMAAVGACLGWVDAVLGLFGAAFVGVAWAAVSWAFKGSVQRTMPFGPYLAVATVLVWFGKPGIEWLLGLISGGAGRIDLP